MLWTVELFSSWAIMPWSGQILNEVCVHPTVIGTGCLWYNPGPPPRQLCFDRLVQVPGQLHLSFGRLDTVRASKTSSADWFACGQLHLVDDLRVNDLRVNLPSFGTQQS